MKKNNNKNNKGAAMIMVICIMALITVLCLSLLLSASVLMSSATKELHQNQSKIVAVSLSWQLGEQITSKVFTNVGEEQNAKDGSLWYYLKEKITNKSWPYYNEDEKGHTSNYSYRYFKLDQSKISSELKHRIDSMDSIKVLMYWESYSDSELDNTPLTIKVTCEKSNERTTITSQYILNCTDILSEDGTELYTQWKWTFDVRE